MTLWFCGSGRGRKEPKDAPAPPTHFPVLPSRPEDGLRAPPPQPCSKPRILCLAAPAMDPVASCWPRARHFRTAQQMLAEPMPHIRAEIRPRLAEALAEADIPQGRDCPSQVGLRRGAHGRVLRPPICSEILNRPCWALATTVWVGDP